MNPYQIKLFGIRLPTWLVMRARWRAEVVPIPTAPGERYQRRALTGRRRMLIGRVPVTPWMSQRHLEFIVDPGEE